MHAWSDVGSPAGAGRLRTAGASRRRGAVGFAWAAVGATAAAMSTQLVGRADAPALGLVEAVSLAVGVLAVVGIGALVIVRGRDALQGWLLLACGSLWGAALAAFRLLEINGGRWGLATARWVVAAGETAATLGGESLVLLLLVVPTGALLSSRWRAVVWLVGVHTLVTVTTAVASAARIVDLDAWLGRTAWTSTAGAVLGPAERRLQILGFVLGYSLLALTVAGLVLRLRSARGEERQQVKWVVVACGTFAVWMVAWFPLPASGWLATFQALAPGLGFVAIAAGFGMALFRYRLWDVDLVLRRSLVYGLLWLAVAGVYVAVAAGLGLAAGARLPVEAAILLTVLATLVFQPARRRMEAAADRWVFGRRRSPVDAMQAVGEVVGGGASDVAADLATSIRGALRLAWVEVAVDGAPAASAGTADGAAVTTTPVACGDERFGTIRCAGPRGRDPTDEERALLDALAAHAGLALSNARLASRLVRAQEVERRRLERNLHDGVQQDLATLVARLALARGSVADDGVAATLDGLRADVQRILGELRDLAQGIHPPVLRDGGLVAAVEDRCSRSAVRASLRVGPALEGRRFPDEIEEAAYYFVSEGLANVVKHADATQVEVRLDLVGDGLRLEVADRGAGLVGAGADGSGLVGLADRFRALGGAVAVEGAPGAGTLLSGRLPVGAGTP